MSSDMNDVLVPLGLGVCSYLITNNNVYAGIITIAGTFVYFKYKDSFGSGRSSLVDGSVNLSLDQTSSDPSHVKTMPAVTDYNTL